MLSFYDRNPLITVMFVGFILGLMFGVVGLVLSGLFGLYTGIRSVKRKLRWYVEPTRNLIGKR